MKSGLKAWVGQRKSDIDKKGKSKAPWVLFWNTPEGKRKEKSCGPGKDGWRLAQKEKQRIHGELVTGTYRLACGGSWSDFRAEYSHYMQQRLAPRTRGVVQTALDHFERIAKPSKLVTITTRTIDDYVSTRQGERGKKKGDTVSPATINKELRHLKAALQKAHKWEFLPKMPDFDFVREPEREPTYVSQEHFAAIYSGCEVARLPRRLPYTAADWWRGLLVTMSMTGWRIGETLSLRWDDVDLGSGTALLRAETTKARRDAVVKLHPVVVDHLRKLKSFEPAVFPWLNHRRRLDAEFHRIQKAADIWLDCPGKRTHECTDACHLYGFHDERRAFATMNAGRMTPDALQALMRHKSYTTTQRYINMAEQVDAAVESLHVPAILQTG